jgi:hypothetical protein
MYGIRTNVAVEPLVKEVSCVLADFTNGSNGLTLHLDSKLSRRIFSFEDSFQDSTRKRPE